MKRIKSLNGFSVGEWIETGTIQFYQYEIVAFSADKVHVHLRNKLGYMYWEELSAIHKRQDPQNANNGNGTYLWERERKPS